MHEPTGTHVGGSPAGDGRSRVRQLWLKEVQVGLAQRPRVLPMPPQADARTYELQDAARTTKELGRVNRELGADFDVDAFSHVVRYNEVCDRVEICLRSQRRQAVRLAGAVLTLDRGELVMTRCAYKYTETQFQ